MSILSLYNVTVLYNFIGDLNIVLDISYRVDRKWNIGYFLIIWHIIFVKLQQVSIGLRMMPILVVNVKCTLFYPAGRHIAKKQGANYKKNLKIILRCDNNLR